jgi:hypothetical protein
MPYPMAAARGAAMSRSAVLVGTGQFFVGTFLTASGTGTTQTVTHNAGFTPKAIVFYLGGLTDETITANFQVGVGFADIGGLGAAVGNHQVDNQSAAGAGPDQQRIITDSRCIIMPKTTGVPDGQCSMSSVSSTQFVLSWTQPMPAEQLCTYLLIAGASVNSTISKFALGPSGNVGVDVAVTAVGFTPTVVLTIGDHDTDATRKSNANVHSHGWMCVDGTQAAAGFQGRTADETTTQNRGQRTNTAHFTVGTAGEDEEDAPFISMDADGFTVDTRAFTAASASDVMAMSLNGLLAHAFRFDKKTDGTGQQTIAHGAGFVPGAILMMTDCAPTDSVAPNPQHARYAIGMSDKTNQGSLVATTTGGLATSVAKTRHDDSKVIQVINSQSTLDAAASLVSLDGTNLVVDWTTNNAEATEIVCLVLA